MDKLIKYQEELRDAKMEIRRLEKLFRETIDAQHQETQNMQKKMKALISDRTRLSDDNATMKIEIRRLTKANTALEQNNFALQAILQETNISSESEIINILDELNGAIDKVSTFLAANLAYIPQELFQQEVDISREATIHIFDRQLLKSIDMLSRRPNSLPLNNFFIKCVFQIFMVKFCKSEVKRRTDKNRLSVANVSSSDFRGISENTSQLSLDEKDLKSKFLQQISHIFKATSWAIPGSDRRDEFQGLLDPFFVSLDALIAFAVLNASHTLFKLVIVGRRNGQSDNGEDNKQKPDEDTVAGCTAIGVEMMTEAKGTNGRSCYKSILTCRYVRHSRLALKFAAADQPSLDDGAKSTNRAQEDGRP